MKNIIKGRIRPLICGVLFTVLTALAAVYVQFLKGDVLDFALSGDGARAFSFGLRLLLCIVIELGAYYGYDYFSGRFVVGVTREMRQLYFRRLLSRNPAEMMEEKAGELAAEYTAQIDMVADSYVARIPMLIEIGFKALVVSTALFILDIRIALLTLFLLTMPLYIPKLIEKHLQAARKAGVDSFQTHLGQVVEWISGFELIKNYSIEGKIMEKFRRGNDETADKSFAYKKMTYRAGTITAAMSYMSHFLVLVFAARLVLRGNFSAGSFFVAVGMIDQLSWPIIAISRYLQDFLAAKPTAQKLSGLLSHTPEEKENTVDVEGIDSVSFRHVGFAYKKGRPILKDFNLEVRTGEKCLITGPSGAGKSTAMNLLMGYYEPAKGQILINGLEAGQVKNPGRHIAVMRQDAALFSDTLRNNLSMYREMPDEDLIDMLRRLNLHRFADAKGLGMMIREGGSNLSGGERKRIALARTLLRRAPVMIIDEPLANVDRETAEMIEDVITGLEGGIVFVISHQFSGEKREAFEKKAVI